MATEVSKARYVRCPKCGGLLMEVADVPVYKCGGCGAVLLAKSRHTKGNGSTQTLNFPLNNVETPHDLPAFIKQRTPFSTDANNIEIGHGGDHTAVLCENPPCSNSENNSPEEESNCSKEQESSECKVESMSMASAPQSQLIQASRDSHSNEQFNGSWKLSQHGSVTSSSSCKMGESAESVVSEEEMADGSPGNRPTRNPGTPIARSSHGCDGSVSSGDDISKHERYRLLSKRTFRSRQLSESESTGTKDGEEDPFVGKKKTASPNEIYGQDGSRDPENLYPVQSELENDHLSRSTSRDSTSLEDFPSNRPNGIPSTRLGNLQNDRMEPLRRMDLLRDQPTGAYAGGRRGVGRVPVEGTRHGGHLPMFSNLETEQVVTPFCNANTPHWRSRASGQETTAQRCQPSRIPFSGQGDGSCLHHRHPEPCNTPVQFPSSILCGTCGSHSCFHHSAPASSSCPEDRHAGLLHNSETSDQDLWKLPCKENRQHRRRRHCRPVSGGAPFVVCSNCLELLQLPADFLVSRGRRHKLRCGACSEVLTFLYHGGHVVPHSRAQLDPSSGEVNNAKHELSVNQSHDSPQEDPVSYSEEYGPPPSQSYSTDGEPVPCILRSSPEQKGKGRSRQTMGPPLHHLMGYASARDLIFVRSDEDERYESMGMSSFYGTSDDIVFDEGYGGKRMSSLLQEHSAVGYSPNHSEIHEEAEPVMRLAGARGGSPLRGFIREDVDELNHGLENMKLRPRRNGRPW